MWLARLYFSHSPDAISEKIGPTQASRVSPEMIRWTRSKGNRPPFRLFRLAIYVGLGTVPLSDLAIDPISFASHSVTYGTIAVE
jgi:hypothetical protein